MIKVLLIFFTIALIPLELIGQKITNSNLLISKERIIDSLQILTTRDSVFTYGFDNDELDGVAFFILPSLGLKNQKEFNFHRKFIEFIDFNQIDTLSAVFIYRHNKKSLAAVMYRSINGYVISPPFLNVDKYFERVIRTFDLNCLFIFTLPFFDEWWAIKNNELFVFSERRSKLLNADDYIKRRYGKNFNNIIQGVILIDNSKSIIKTLEKMRVQNDLD